MTDDKILEDLDDLESIEDMLDAPVEQEDPYPDYSADNSRVISGPLSNAKFPGQRFRSWGGALSHARKLATEKGVRMYRFWTVTGRWFARIGK